MWLGKNKIFKKTNEASKKEFSDEVKELNVQIRKDDNTHGQDIYSWPNGDTFGGEWEEGKKNGQGTYTWADGAIYIGEWKDNMKNGHGTYTWPNGVKYMGERKDNKKTAGSG